MLRLPQTAAVLALIGLSACRTEAPVANEAEPARNEAEPATPIALPQPEQPLDREAVLLAVIMARSAAAAGADDQAAQTALDGKRFEFRIALGCNLAEAGQEGAGATFDPERRRVELSAPADATLSDAAVAAAAGAAEGGAFEAAEGFWIADPWLLAPHCAGAAPADAAASPEPAPAPAPERKSKSEPAAAPEEAPAARAGGVALVQYFTPQDPRTGRRGGRPYEARETLPEGSEAPAPGSWELVLTGRLQALGDGRVVACTPAGPGAPPACVVSVRFDRVGIENRASGEMLAEWGSR